MISIQLSRIDMPETERYREGEYWEFVVDETIPRTDLLVSSVRLWKISDEYTGIRYWSRGRGTTTEWQIVATKDALAVAARLFGLTLTEFANGVAFSLKNTFLVRLG